jgi:transcription antitermination factor NusG
LQGSDARLIPHPARRKVLPLNRAAGKDRPAEIARIREGLATGCILRPHPAVSLGEIVRVHRGVFAGVEGTTTEFRHPCKVVIALSATKQCFSLEVDLDDIEVLRQPVAKEVLSQGRRLALSGA